MARKTNKTSHVLNLITNGAPAEPETKAAEDAEAGNPETDSGLNTPTENDAGEAGAAPAGALSQAGGEAAPGSAPAASVSAQTAPQGTGAAAPAAPQAGTDKKVIVVDDSDSDKISEEIKGRLEEHLEQTMLQAAEEEAKRAEKAESEPEAPEAERLESEGAVENGSRPESDSAVESGSQPESSDAVGEESRPEDESAAEAEVNAGAGQMAEPEVPPMAEEGQAESRLSEPADDVSDSESKQDISEQETEPAAAEPAVLAEEAAETEPPREEILPEGGAPDESTEALEESASETDSAGGANPSPVQEETPASGDMSPVQEKEYQILNVVEKVLGRTNLKDQMEKYDVCTCSRCCADVMALCLTCLPPKYVVVDGSPTAPIIGYYESRNRARIITEIVKACMLVKEKPRHNEYEITGDVLR